MLKQNGEFYFENKPEIDICENGTYKYYKSGNESEVGFDCGNINSSAKIVSNLSSLKLNS